MTDTISIADFKLLAQDGRVGKGSKRRPNAANDGSAFETLIEKTLEIEERAGRMYVEHVDPPIVITKEGPKMKRNPFLDYMGNFRAARGSIAMPLVFEAKSTIDPDDDLAFNGEKGFTQRQVQALLRWTVSGAVTFLLWQSGRRIGFVSADVVLSCKITGLRALRFDVHTKPARYRADGLPDLVQIATVAYTINKPGIAGLTRF